MSKILIAEDDKFLIKVYETKLKAESFDVILASNGQEAVDKAKIEKPELILLDLIMPVMTGFEALEALKSDESTKDIPVVILSNLGQEADLKKGMKLGAVDFVVKANASIQEVTDKIKSFL